MKTRNLTAAAIVAVATGATLAAATPAAVAKDGADGRMELRVGTYNIRTSSGDKGTPNAWDARKADLAYLVRSFDLDAFGLQEVKPDQADYLKKKLPGYAMVGVHREDGKRKGEASPVFYRKDRFDAVKSGTFWLSETPDVPGSKSWGAANTRICSWAWLKDKATGRTFCFANTHTDHRSVLARKEGMLLIVRRMREFAPEGTPVVFTGDHNCRETEESARAVAERLRNAVHVSETTPTGPWRSCCYGGWRRIDDATPCAVALGRPAKERNAGSDGLRIDYIYVSDGVRVKSVATHDDTRPGTDLYFSDHFPVTAVIEL